MVRRSASPQVLLAMPVGLWIPSLALGSLALGLWEGRLEPVAAAREPERRARVRRSGAPAVTGVPRPLEQERGAATARRWAVKSWLEWAVRMRSLRSQLARHAALARSRGWGQPH